MQAPTIGRTVLYRHKVDRFVEGRGSEPMIMPAIVTFTVAGQLVDLTAFPRPRDQRALSLHPGEVLTMEAVPGADEVAMTVDGNEQEKGTWRWPPRA